jgi:hypothetical protein
MNARPAVKEVLIQKRIKKWWLIARCPQVDPKCLPVRARRNYLRLVTKYPEVAERLGLTVVSVYAS